MWPGLDRHYRGGRELNILTGTSAYFLCSMNTTTSSSSLNSTAADDRTTAIVSYLTLVGFIVAVIMHGTKKTQLGSFHLRQSLGLMLTSIAVAMAATILAFIPFVGWLAALAAWFGLMAL